VPAQQIRQYHRRLHFGKLSASNVQIAVDAAHKLLVCTDVVNDGNDKNQLVPTKNVKTRILRRMSPSPIKPRRPVMTADFRVNYFNTMNFMMFFCVPPVNSSNQTARKYAVKTVHTITFTPLAPQSAPTAR
jgi:hypothetical protein